MPPTAAARVPVVAAFYPLAEAVRQVGGDAVRVTDLTPAGAEPHDLELTTRQVDALEDADLVVAMGHEFQPAVEDVARRRAEEQTVFVLDDLSIDAGDKSVEGGGSNALDPHVWLDPKLMQEIVATVAESLGRVDPEHAASYSANAEAYSEQLAALDQEYAARARALRTRRDRDGARGVRLAARGATASSNMPSPASPPTRSRRRIGSPSCSDLAERDGVTTIFTETLVSPRRGRDAGARSGRPEDRDVEPARGSRQRRDRRRCRLSLRDARQPAVAARCARVLVI